MSENKLEVWDRLSKYFDTHKNPGEIPAGAADNILIAWPSIIKIIKTQVLSSKPKMAVDLGCGSGAFCVQLSKMGFRVTGIDPSEGMVAVARRNVPKDIKIILGTSKELSKFRNKLAVVSSIMALQFDGDIKKTIVNVESALESDGVVVIAVFNPNYVSSCIKAGVLFADFDDSENPTHGFMLLNGEMVPTYIRTAQEYDELFQNVGLEKIAEVYPAFTPGFLKEYPMDTPTDQPEYMVLAYKKPKTS